MGDGLPAIPSPALVLAGGARWGVECADALAWLRGLPDGVVQTCVTSPPYYGLRDYGAAGQIGLEDTPAAYVERLVGVFREVRRVLHETGTLWLNLGDSYAATSKGSGGKENSTLNAKRNTGTVIGKSIVTFEPRRFDLGAAGVKPKDLLGIPWRVAFALQSDGWYLRSDIIWSKPNPMPESVTDRPTKSHEYLFLLAKSQRYFYDAMAIAEPATGTDDRPQQQRAVELAEGAGLTAEHIDAIRSAGVTDVGKATTTQNGTGCNTERVRELAAEAKRALGGYYREFLMEPTKNKRSVWDISLKPYKGAHFAVMPKALVRPCVEAGTPAKGCCPKCRAPWRRKVERDRRPTRPGLATKVTAKLGGDTRTAETKGWNRPNDLCNRDPKRHCTLTRTTGWEPGCGCGEAETIPAVVMDPFTGSGTVGAVAVDLGRSFAGSELNPDYLPLIARRMGGVTPALFTEGGDEE